MEGLSTADLNALMQNIHGVFAALLFAGGGQHSEFLKELCGLLMPNVSRQGAELITGRKWDTVRRYVRDFECEDSKILSSHYAPGTKRHQSDAKALDVKEHLEFTYPETKSGAKTVRS